MEKTSGGTRIYLGAIKYRDVLFIGRLRYEPNVGKRHLEKPSTAFLSCLLLFSLPPSKLDLPSACGLSRTETLLRYPVFQ